MEPPTGQCQGHKPHHGDKTITHTGSFEVPGGRGSTLEKAKPDLWGHCERLDASPQEWEGDNVQYSEAHEFREPPSEQAGPQIAAVTAMQRAQFLATSTEVSILDSKGAVAVQLSALIDSGAVMSCTPTSPVLSSSIGAHKHQ